MSGGRVLDPSKVVARFDSASVLHAATVAVLKGRPFPHLGNGGLTSARSGRRASCPGRSCGPCIPGSAPQREFRSRELGNVDMSTGAASFVDAYPGCRYPAVMVGSSNGALTNLAVAARVPWLPDTVLGPVAGAHDRPDDVLAFGASVAAPLLDPNPPDRSASHARPGAGCVDGPTDATGRSAFGRPRHPLHLTGSSAGKLAEQVQSGSFDVAPVALGVMVDDGTCC